MMPMSDSYPQDTREITFDDYFNYWSWTDMEIFSRQNDGQFGYKKHATDLCIHYKAHCKLLQI